MASTCLSDKRSNLMIHERRLVALINSGKFQEEDSRGIPIRIVCMRTTQHNWVSGILMRQWFLRTLSHFISCGAIYLLVNLDRNSTEDGMVA